MKKRSEATPMRKRGDAPQPQDPKPSSEERTINMFASGACPACEEKVDLSKVTVRKDGTPECPSCGAPLPKPSPELEAKLNGADAPLPTSGVAERGVAEALEAPMGEASQKALRERAAAAAAPVRSRPDPRPEDLPKAYCNECGAEWPRGVNGDTRPFPNCGHVDGFVDHPGKARKYNPPAGHPRLLDVVKQQKDPVIQMPIEIAGDEAPPRRTFSAEWGKVTFNVAEYSSMTIGPFSAFVDVAPGASIADAARAVRAELRKIADEAFDEQLAWYREKLGIVGGKRR